MRILTPLFRDHLHAVIAMRDVSGDYPYVKGSGSFIRWRKMNLPPLF
jgi:hypothetical protein